MKRSPGLLVDDHLAEGADLVQASVGAAVRQEHQPGVEFDADAVVMVGVRRSPDSRRGVRICGICARCSGPANRECTTLRIYGLTRLHRFQGAGIWHPELLVRLPRRLTHHHALRARRASQVPTASAYIARCVIGSGSPRAVLLCRSGRQVACFQQCQQLVQYTNPKARSCQTLHVEVLWSTSGSVAGLPNWATNADFHCAELRLNKGSW